MAIGVLFEFPGATQSQYDAVEKKMTNGGKLKKLADWPAKGLLMHLAGPTRRAGGLSTCGNRKPT